MTEVSTHLTREKKSDDKLELILEPWGVWRQWGVDGLSSKRKSPLEGYNSIERGRTDELDRERSKVLSLPEYREWILKINSLNVPRETQKVSPISPNYGGHKYYSKIDRILSGIYQPYYNILIKKYENQWDINTFAIEYGVNYNLAKRRLFKARQAARRELIKNGYKA